MNTLTTLRAIELGCIDQYFSTGKKVLEIGGGNGFQAKMIADMGCAVISVDIPPIASSDSFFKVIAYDGIHLPLEDKAIDVVFSSNVLEHIKTLGITLNESRRVLADDGLAIHILPTPTWRLWTSLAHYVYLIFRLLGINRSVGGKLPPTVSEKLKAVGVMSTIQRVLFAAPHGEYPSAWSELWYFSKARWLSEFERQGFELVSYQPTRLFYSGYTLFPGLSQRSRAIMSRFLGSSTAIFVLRKKASHGN